LPWNERYTDQHVAFIADAIAGVADRLRKAA
jgi:hypothetical protein